MPGCGAHPPRPSTHAKAALVEAVLKDNAYPSERVAQEVLLLHGADLLFHEQFEGYRAMAKDFQQHRSAFAVPPYLLAAFSDVAYHGTTCNPYSRDFARTRAKLAAWEAEKDAFKETSEAAALVGNVERSPSNYTGRTDDCERAHRLVLEAMALAPTDVEPHIVLIDLASHWTIPAQTAQQSMRQALRLQPGNLAAYLAVAHFCRPQFYRAAAGELVSFADQAAADAPDYGQGLYALVLWRAGEGSIDSFMKSEKVDWGRMKQGFADLEKKFGPSLWMINNFCHFACAAADRSTAQSLFARLDDEYLPGAWADRAEFDQWQEWAFASKASASASAAAPPLVIAAGKEAAYHLSPFATLAEFRLHLHDLLRRHKYLELEEIARALHEPDVTRPGSRTLHNFYLALEESDFASTADAYQANLQDWLQHCPESVAAHVAVARAWERRAWQALGTEASRASLAAPAAAFVDGMKHADQMLEEASHQHVADAELYIAWMQVAVAHQWPLDRCNGMLDKALNLDPFNAEVYRSKVQYLLPRWYGAPGDLEGFAQKAVDKTHGKMGRAMYAAIASQVLELEGDKRFADTSLLWTDIVQGFHDMSPDAAAWNPLARMACLKADRQTAKDAFTHIGDEWDPRLWDMRKDFLRWRAWAGIRQP